MGCSKSNVPRPVFIETNLGTRLAVPASPDITAKELKRELERAHLNYFPEFGSITVNALMVKQRSCCYHLSDSLPLKYAFLGSNGAWFLQISVHPRSIPDPIESSKCNGSELHNIYPATDVVTDSVGLLEKTMKCKRKKVKIQTFPYLKAAMLNIPAVFCLLKRRKKRKYVKRNRKIGGRGHRPIQQPRSERGRPCQFASRPEANWSISETFSEAVSVSGIIKKYFSDYDEVASTSGFPFTRVRDRRKERLSSIAECTILNVQSDITSPATGEIPPQQVTQDVCLEKPGSEALREKRLKPEVGKRLLLASGSLGLTPSNKRPALSLCRSDDRKPPSNKSPAIVRHLVFEMTGEGD